MQVTKENSGGRVEEELVTSVWHVTLRSALAGRAVESVSVVAPVPMKVSVQVPVPARGEKVEK